jgi:nitrite reductase (NADH) large subunit
MAAAKGCDVCNAAGRLDPRFLLERDDPQAEHAPLQDTNDYFLANMQKNGTTRSCRACPAARSRAEKLIVLGRWRAVRLYTKITGASASTFSVPRVEQLPLIWQDLIAAGFESGHAYGKALRTVKSCVGSTWCRFGVQDSVTMAIDIENRYRGCARRTRSKWPCPAARASAPRRRARTSA